MQQKIPQHPKAIIPKKKKGQLPTQSPASTSAILLNLGGWELCLFLPLFISLIKTPIPKAARWNALTEGSLQGTLCWPESAAESILCLWAGILGKLLTENRTSPLAEYSCACCYTRHPWGISLLCSGSFTLSWKDAKWITPENRSRGDMICSIFQNIILVCNHNNQYIGKLIQQE